MACLGTQRNTPFMSQPKMRATIEALRGRRPIVPKSWTNGILFPPGMYGEWHRFRYCVSRGKEKLITCNKTGEFSISFHRTQNGFIRTSQINRMKRVCTTWITDGEWHDHERITIESETQFSREAFVNNVHCRETVQLFGSILQLIGFNGRFWYRAVFRKSFYPMKPIPEENEEEI